MPLTDDEFVQKAIAKYHATEDPFVDVVGVKDGAFVHVFRKQDRWYLKSYKQNGGKIKNFNGTDTNNWYRKLWVMSRNL